MQHRLVPGSRQLVASLSLVTLVAACGPRHVAPPPPPPIAAPAPPPTEDLEAELGPLALTGSAFTPQAVPPTPMVRTL